MGNRQLIEPQAQAHKRSVRRDDKGHFINEKVLGFRAEAGGAYAY
jgi:hypothetical protein